MPDQTTPNPAGGTTQPSSSAAQSIQAAQESAWLQMRDQAKTPADVSRMMVDLSADDFNALGAQISEAKRYGRKEVSYKGHNIPVPDKPFSAIKKDFEERQSLSKSRIEQASTGLSQQIFGGLGNILGGKKEKKEEGRKKKGTEKGSEKIAEEKPTASAGGATVRETTPPTLATIEAPTVRVPENAERTIREVPAADEAPTLKREVEAPTVRMAARPEQGPTGTIRIPQPETKTGPTGTVRLPKDVPTSTVQTPTPSPETEVTATPQATVAKTQKNKYDDIDVLVESMDKAKVELEKSKEQMREILNKPKISSQDAVKFASIEKGFSDSTDEVAKYLGVSLIDDEYNDIYSQFRKKIEQDVEVDTAYAKEDSRLRQAYYMDPKTGKMMEPEPPTPSDKAANQTPTPPPTTRDAITKKYEREIANAKEVMRHLLAKKELSYHDVISFAHLENDVFKTKYDLTKEHGSDLGAEYNELYGWLRQKIEKTPGLEIEYLKEDSRLSGAAYVDPKTGKLMPPEEKKQTQEELFQTDPKFRAEIQATNIIGKPFYNTNELGRVHVTRVEDTRLESDGKYLLRLLDEDGRLEIRRVTPEELNEEIMTRQDALKKQLQQGNASAQMQKKEQTGNVTQPIATASVTKAAAGASVGVGVGTAAMAAGIAGAALGAAVETAAAAPRPKAPRPTPRQTATGGGAKTTQTTEQKTTTTVSKEPTTAKATISTEAKTQVQGAPTTPSRPSAAPGRQVTADVERKVEIEERPPTSPPPPAGGPTRVEAKIEKDVSVEARQQARAGFGIPGAPPPSAPSGGASGGPKGPSRIPTPRELLSQSDALMAETKALSGRMARNPKDVMLKAQARILREHTDSLIDQLQTTQQQGTLLEPEQAGLEELGMRLGVLSGALGGEPGMGQATEMGIATGLYDQQRDRLGGALAPSGGAAPPRPSGGPKPTGAAGPSPVGTTATTGGGKSFPGPQAPRPMSGPAARGGRGSQLGTAMQLGAMQQQAATQAGQSEPEIVSDDSVPQDVREQIMGEGGGQRGSSVLPGQYAPPGYEDVYGGGRGPQHRARTERMPGSAVGEDEELTEAELMEGGGEIGSDEAERARVLSEQQSQARRASDFSGAPAMPGITGPGPAAGKPPQRQAPPPPQPKPATGARAGAGGGAGAVAGILAMQQAMALSSQQEQSRFRRIQSVKDQIEGVRRVQRNLQNIWRVVNASELASSEAVFPIIMWVITSNLQLLNKLSFKVKFIPPASIPEDGLTFCVDCLLGSACLINMVWYMGITVLIALPYIIIGTTVGAEGFDLIMKALDMLAGWI